MENIHTVIREMESFHTRSADEVRARQNERVAEIVRFHYNNNLNPTYRQLLQQAGIENESELPTSVEGLRALPKVNRSVLEQGQYAERPAVEHSLLQKIIETSGSSGTPLRLPHTRESVLRCYGVSLARAAWLGGLDPTSHSYFVGHWVPGVKDVWTSHEAMCAFQELVGDVALIETTHVKLPGHLSHLQEHKPLWAASTPSFFLALAAFAADQGVDLRAGTLRHLLLGGGTCLPENRRVLEAAYGLESLRLIYPTSESFLSATEMSGEAGYLCFGDEYVVEVVDENDQPVGIGERGRILITCLGNRGYPGIRYMQGDAVTFLGYSSAFPGFIKIDRPERVDAGEIGEARLLITEIEAMQRALLEAGIPTSAFQLARRRVDSKDVPVFRIETRTEDHEQVEQALLSIFLKHPVMKDMLDGKMILPPVVELYKPGDLTVGRAKVPFYVDERNR